MSAHSRERERPHTRAHKSVSDRPLMVSVSEERPLTLAKNAHERELYSPSQRYDQHKYIKYKYNTYTYMQVLVLVLVLENWKKYKYLDLRPCSASG